MAKILDLVRGKAETFGSMADIEDPLLKRKVPELREKDMVRLLSYLNEDK